MKTWLETAAVLISAAGLVSAMCAYRLTRTFRPALLVLLDFLTAAGLIRLSGDLSRDSIVLAAAVIALRKLLGIGLGLSHAATWPQPPPVS